MIAVTTIINESLSSMGVSVYSELFLPHLAGGKAASWVGSNIVLDHMRVYIIFITYLIYSL